MNARLQQFLSAENISQAQFADNIKVARASVSHILAGRNRPGYDFIINTMQHYPELNIEWLLTGKGKMYRSSFERDDNARQTPVSASYDSPAKTVVPEQSSDGKEREITLFDMVDEPRESQKSELPPDSQQNIEISEGSAQPVTAPQQQVVAKQQTVNQRKASKVIVFFDDGTFQEF